MADMLLATKLHIPPVRSEYVSRPRLDASLQDGMRRKLTVLSAPAGFGKSTLLAGWIHQKNIPAGWLFLDDGENDLTRFVSYLVAALNSIKSVIGSSISDTIQATQLRTPEPVLNIIINELSEIDFHIALILDDYHLIRSQSVHNALKYLLDHQPVCLHLYLATRVDPALPLALLRGRGEMIELRANDLRFTREESAKFIQRAANLTLSDIDANTLTQLTEGWITGIQMAAISMKSCLDVATFLQEFSGSNRYVLDYLVEEVLATQPEKTKKFLYRTSILERMSGPLCDALLASKCADIDVHDFSPGDGERMLVDLDHKNLFTIPLDENRHWFRYHHLFAELLRQRFQAHDPELVRQLHKRAATWYQAQDAIPEAIRHSLACGDYPTAIEMIDAIADDTMMRSEFAMLKGWIEHLPDHILVDHPRLYSYHLFTAIFNGTPAEETIQQLKMIQEVDREKRIRGDILALQALLAVYNQNIQLSADLCEQALEILPDDSIFFRSTIAGFLGFAYLMHGDTELAKRTLEESARVSDQAGNLTMYVLALCHLAEIAYLENRISEAETKYRQVLNIGLDAEGKPRPILGLALIGLGILQYERGQLIEAFDSLIQGVELVQKFAPSAAVRGYVHLAFIHQYRGNEASADSLFEAAAELARRFEPMEEDDEYVLYNQAKLQLKRGNPIQALEYFSINPEISLNNLDLAFPSVKPERLQTFTNLIRCFIMAEAFLALERYQIAEHLLSRVWETIKKKGWTRLEMSIMTTQAEIHVGRGNLDQACQILSQALSIAAQSGYVIDFLERGSHISGLLRRALHAGIEPEFVAHLLARIEAQDMGIYPTSPSEKANLMLLEPLSDRELEVLVMVAEGYTNAEIASHLVLAVNTVKKHVSNILGKLGVSNRNEAASRGRELGLI